MVRALSLHIRAIHRSELMGRVPGHRAVDRRFETSEVLLESIAVRATSAKTKSSYARRVVICHRPVNFLLIRAAVKCRTPV